MGEEGILGFDDPLLAGEAQMISGKHRLGFMVEGPQQLALPAVPHAGSDGANVGDGEEQKQFQPLGRLHQGSQRTSCRVP